jgi:hypothetical protein
VRTN